MGAHVRWTVHVHLIYMCTSVQLSDDTLLRNGRQRSSRRFPDQRWKLDGHPLLG